MKAAVFESIGNLAIHDVEEPQLLSSHDVKLRVLACGICGTDLHILADPPAHPGTIGAILGHEFVAEVVEVGADVVTVKPGQRVAARPIVSCGACHYCLSGAINHCENWQVHGVFVNGGLAEYMVISDIGCIPISEEVPIEIAAMTEPLACVMSAIRKISLLAGETVVVLGAGAIGLMYLAILKASGASKIIVVEPSEWRAKVALEMGATAVINPIEQDTAAEVAKILPRGADVVVDAVGSQFPVGVQLAGRKGRVVLFGMNTKAEAPIKQHLITEKELSIIGSFVGQNSFPDAIRLLESGLIDFSPIASNIYKLSELPESFAEIRGGSVVKAIVTI